MRSRIVPFLFVTALAGLPANPAIAQTDPLLQDNSAALFERGRRLLDSGDPHAAVTALSRAVARQPEKSEYSLALAEAYIRARDFDAAERLLVPLAASKETRQRAALLLAQRDAARRDWQSIAERLAPLRDTLEAPAAAVLADALLRLDRAREALDVAADALRRAPKDPALVDVKLRSLLATNRPALAMRELEAARRAGIAEARLAFYAADAYFRMDRVLGDCALRIVPRGEVGQFAGEGLLLEAGAVPDQFLVCPPASAMYQIRRAIDEGLDDPAAFVLYARIWGRIEKPAIGLALLDAHAGVLRDACPAEYLGAQAELSLISGDIPGFLKATNARAALPGADANAVLAGAFDSAARRCNERGDAEGHRQFLRRLLQLRPDDGELRLSLADALWNAGERDEALTWYRRILEAHPGHAERRRLLDRLSE